MHRTLNCVLSHCTFHVLLSLLLIALEGKRCYENGSALFLLKIEYLLVKRTSCNS